MLAGFGIQTTTARSGRTALDLCDGECPFDVVLADVVMPEIGGFELAAILRDQCPQVPVILMTGHDELVDGVVEAGALPLLKPFTTLRLKQIIDDALER